ncbi:MAG: cobalamin-dependent protein [Bacillota bacterium]|jgi:methanogenic corrinoid protein MtbC1|nr:cobalamin-dependent protein [Bacillota bacterium]
MDELAKSVVQLDQKQTLELVKSKLEKGVPVENIIEDCRQGMEIVGEKFSQGEYYLPELIMAGEIFNSIIEVLRPVLAEAKTTQVGKIVLATVKNDIHDIGKNVFKGFAEANGFEVRDLGVDVEPGVLISAIKEEKPDIVGLSCLLTSAFDSIKETIDKIKEAGVRGEVKIIIGGAPVSRELKEWAGADAATRSAAEGVNICKELLNARVERGA